MNKLLTTAIIGAVLSASSFASTPTNTANITVSGTMTNKSPTFAQGVADNVTVESSGKLKFDTDTTIESGDTLTLKGGATIDMANHTVTNNGTIIVKYGASNPTFTKNDAGNGTIAQNAAAGETLGSIILRGTDSTNDITSVTIEGGSTGGVTLTPMDDTAAGVYRANLSISSIDELHGSSGGYSTTAINILSVKQPTDPQLLINDEPYNLGNRPEVQYTDSSSTIIKLSTAVMGKIDEIDDSPLLSNFGIKFQNANGDDVKLATTASKFGDITALTGAASNSLVVIDKDDTTIDLVELSSTDTTILADLTNISGVSSDGDPKLTYANGIKIKGSSSDGSALILSGNISELIGVTYDIPLKITGSTVPDGTLASDKTMTLAGSATLSGLLNASAGTLAFDTTAGDVTLTVDSNGTLIL